MIYFKRILLVSIFIISINPAFCFYQESWYSLKKQESLNIPSLEFDNEVLIDTYSINTHNDSVYYTLSYLDKTKGQLFVIVQSKKNKAGIVKTYNYREYSTIMQDSIKYNHPAYTTQTTNKWFDITPKSLIYKANEFANECVEERKASFSKIIPQKAVGKYKTYIQEIEKSLNKKWLELAVTKGEEVVVLFRISKNGEVLFTKIQQSSGYLEIDKLAIKTIKQSAPFKTFPDDWQKENIDIEHSFGRSIGKGIKNTFGKGLVFIPELLLTVLSGL